jgi:transposase
VRLRSRLTRQAEAEALWQLKDRSFSQVKRELRVGYSTLRRLLEKETDVEALGFIHTTNGFTEGCHTKIKMLKRVSYGLRNMEVYWRKMLLGFVPSSSYFYTI